VTLAPTIDELTIADDPAPWVAAGFTVTGDECVIGDVSLRLAGAGAGPGILEWALRDLASDVLDGLPTRRSERAVPQPAAAHENGVSALDHVVAVSPALDRTAAALQAAGLDLRRVREEPTPAGAPRQAFFRLGAVILEVVQEPDEVIARGGGIERPAHFWGLALLSGDLERTVAAFAPHVSEIRDAVQPGRRIATVRRAAGFAVPIALMSAAGEPAPSG
jgi:hypothetical protein